MHYKFDKFGIKINLVFIYFLLLIQMIFRGTTILFLAPFYIRLCWVWIYPFIPIALRRIVNEDLSLWFLLLGQFPAYQQCLY